MSDILKKYLMRSVPRYTSYPTAPHFSAVEESDVYARSLAALTPDDPISLYLHVPFCRQLCWYCGCNMKLATREAPITQYAQTLKREIRLLAQHLPTRMKISHLHWGGGTPTALVPDDLQGVMETVADCFDILPDAELAIESDPRTLSDEMIRRIGQLGFNRASFGVQEFDPKVQAAINRIQPPDMVARAVDGLRNAGVLGINFDLIYGLPHQTVDTLLNTIELCADMAPDRIALFGYAHVPWAAKKQRLIDEAALPGADERLRQANAAAQALEKAGYVALGLDHFALPSDPLALAAERGALRRNFQGYTTDQAQTMLGVGTTSIGKTPSSYIQNISETGAWARSVKAGKLPVGRACQIDDQDKLRGEVIEKLMCQGRVDLCDVSNRHGVSDGWWHALKPALEEFRKDGLASLDKGVLQVTPMGQPIMRVIASVFDTYLEANVQRHAVAV